MMDTALAIAIITVVVIVIVYIWDDLMEEIILNTKPDPPKPPARSHGERSLIMSLCEVTEYELTTPRGVKIPAEDLLGDFDLGDALDYLEEVEALG